ncbi:Hypothetical protein, putative [Bodo saltans]|uniref:Uncharacterized protein n=1 Tax=Bodo saltans TaxID=75058 RepID=A0A0S4IZB5_BODSA|nr:Hypothetical protein, putative [Bodo saltans]|eukprot:CUG18094.1 Hypothetical protein, putative [Bodo saltans]
MSSTLPEQELFTVETTNELIEDITLDVMDNSSMFDALFWSADGLALIQPDQQKEESAFVFKDISANSSTSSAPDTTAPLDAITLHTVTVRNDLHGLQARTIIEQVAEAGT